jgi:hypothetical protein
MGRLRSVGGHPTNGCFRRISPTPVHPGDGLLSDHIAGFRPVWRERVFMPRSCHSRLTPTVATRSFKSIPMSRLGDGSCGDAFLDVGPACGN